MKLVAWAAALVFAVPILLIAPPAPSLPTPGINCQVADVPLPVAVRYVPEPEQTNDFISYAEARMCLDALSAAYPARIEVKTLGPSYGLENHVTGARDSHDVFIVEVTNENSNVSFDGKLKVLFMLSIHGNEKGGREGGLRAIEDFVRDMGIAGQAATGHPDKTLYDLMDQVVLLFLFPNVDGWLWDEPEYADPAGCAYPGLYKRYNGHCTDLNRQLPTAGWQYIDSSAGRTPMAEPEPRAYAPTLINYTNVVYASDIHGMLNPADGRLGPVEQITGGISDAAPSNEETYGHFVLGLLSAGQLNPQEMLRSTRLAEILNDRLNSDPVFAGWSTLPSTSVWGGEYYTWSSVWDTIGYTDSGISGDWFLQDTGLNAPGMDFEMAYNHITFDSAYPGVAQLMNVYHVETVRQIVRAYLEAAVTDVQTSVEAHDRTTAYLYNPTLVTDKDDAKALDGWAKENPADDPWDLDHIDFEAAANDYFRDLKWFMKSGDQPAVFDELQASEITLENLKAYDNFVVAGSAVSVLAEGQTEVLKAYVEQGGNLVLTDQGLQLLDPIVGLQASSTAKYAGMTLLVDREHALAAHSVKLSRQTYEPVPLGFSLDSNNAPVWFVNRDAFESKGGKTVGTVPAQGHTNPDGDTNLGQITVGAGTVTFLGALVPDPTEEFYHPYGLESYATTYFGNLLFYNMIGAEQVFDEPPVVLDNVGRQQPLPTDSDGKDATNDEGGSGVPGLGFVAILAGLGVAALGLRRRK